MSEGGPPGKTREIQNHHIDSTVWNDFKFRDDDIVIASYAKSGTTWLQQIIAQLLFDGEEDLGVAEMSPWLEFRITPARIKLARLEAQTHRRFVKTHLPVDALVFCEQAKYIYIGRDGRDILWSLYNHHSAANESWYVGINDTPGRVGPPIEKPPLSIKQYYNDWLERDGYPLWSFWDNVRSWWEIKNLPNVTMLHFAELTQDMPGQIRRIAEFLEIPVNEKKWDLIVSHCEFNYMKKHGEKIVPYRGVFWEGGFQTFIHRGSNGRWRDVLSRSEIEKYERIAMQKLGGDCAHWLATGGSKD
jgi:aryl sulfotransferase